MQKAKPMRVKLIKDWTRKGKTIKAGTEIIISSDALPQFVEQGLVAGKKTKFVTQDEAPEEEPKRTSIWGKAN